MRITERTEAARWAFEDALESQKGLMKTFRALTSATRCFFSSRKVKAWQDRNTAIVSSASTGQEKEVSVGTSIGERTAAMQAELQSLLNERGVVGEAQSGNSEFGGEDDSAGVKKDEQAASVAEPEKTEQPESTFDELVPDRGERLISGAVRDKMKVRPPNRKAPTRNPDRR